LPTNGRFDRPSAIIRLNQAKFLQSDCAVALIGFLCALADYLFGNRLRHFFGKRASRITSSSSFVARFPQFRIAFRLNKLIS